MPTMAQMHVAMIGKTEFFPPPTVPWETDVDGGEALIEFAGRACYQSWAKPNPATAHNAAYIDHLLDVGHLSVLEHGSVSFYITGVSRSLTHELVRHRHMSYSQLSQRFVGDRGAEIVVPDAISRDGQLLGWFGAAVGVVLAAYTDLARGLEQRFAVVPNATQRRKLVRQAARAILPNATETKIVVTGNYRAWRHFIAMRATEHADVEIRELAIAILRQLQIECRNVFHDFKITSLADGSEVASSPYIIRGL